MTTTTPTRPEGRPATGSDALVDETWLAAHLNDPAVRIVEIDVSRGAYEQWHIPGAALWNIYADLRDSNYQPVAIDAVRSLVSRSGISAESTVVFYGYAPALGFWLLKHLGHESVHVLDCSRDTWRADGHPCTSTQTQAAATVYPTVALDNDAAADQDRIRRTIGRSDVLLVDVRTRSEYDGERFWPSGGMQPGGRAGHIPTAVHQPIDGLYDERGAFRERDDLRQVLNADALAGTRELITYCTVGGRAATAWFALTQLLGRTNVRAYIGSWAEWGLTPGNPVETTSSSVARPG